MIEDAERDDAPTPLLPRPVNGWRNYTHYRCPGCGHLEKQLTRTDDALPRIKAHVERCM